MARDVDPLAAIATEIATYEAKKEELLRKAKGKHVLIKGRRVLGIYDTWQEASAAAQRRLGNVPCLIHEVVRREKVWFI